MSRRQLQGRCSHFVGWMLMIALFGFGAAAVAAPIDQREIVLSANVRIENRGDENVAEQVVSLTIPGDISDQQKVLSITVPGQPELDVFIHPNQVDKFMMFYSSLPAHSVKEHTAQFRIRLTRFDYKWLRGNVADAGNSNFLRPTTYVESTAPEITDLANQIVASQVGDEALLLAAYRYPQQALRYRLIDNRGALFALRNGYGDCTEYAALFAALARAMDFPARLTSEFNFSGSGEFSQPNHHAAEVFLGGQWIPVDPNLGTDINSDYGFGVTGLHKVVLKRDGSWVWSSSSQGVTKAYRDANIAVQVRWTIQTQ